MVEERASFQTPQFASNLSGWGPTSLPDQFVGVPFAPFSKSDKIGRVADFVGKEHGKVGGRYHQREDESVTVEKFNLVDTSKTRSGRGAFRGRWNRRRFQQQQRRSDTIAKPQLKGKQLKYVAQHQRRGKQWRRPRNSGRSNYRRKTRQLETSVKINADWEVVEQFDLNVLTKMQIQPPNAEDIKVVGSLYPYNDALDKITTRTSIKLNKEVYRGDVYPSGTTSDDPVIIDLARNVNKSSDKAAVFCTDELLAQIMVSTRSVFPWDVVFTRLDNDIILLDKREDSKIDRETVNETAQALTEDEEALLAAYNTQESLQNEATAVNQILRQQSLKRTKKKVFSKENPLLEADEDSDEEDDPEFEARNKARENLAVAYRYRKFELGTIDVYARTELHAICKQAGKKSFATVYAFNEWDSKVSKGVDWRPKIDNQRGVLIANELSSNAFRIGKWTARTLLSGAETMRIGFVSRKTKTDSNNHTVLAVQQFDPVSLATQINIRLKNMWGIFKAIIDIVLKQERGKYILLKDPNRQVLRLYKIPIDQEVDGSDDDDEEDENPNNYQ